MSPDAYKTLHVPKEEFQPRWYSVLFHREKDEPLLLWTAVLFTYLSGLISTGLDMDKQ